ncbi:hypothetical protein ACQVBX_05555 [Dyella sp. KULCS107]
MSTVRARTMNLADAPPRALVCVAKGLNNRNGNNRRLSGRAIA